MESLSPLVWWDAALLVLVLVAGALVRWLPGASDLRRRCGGRMMAAALLFAVAIPLDLWKAGVGVLVALAGTLALLTWCMVTVCRQIDEGAPPKGGEKDGK